MSNFSPLSRRRKIRSKSGRFHSCFQGKTSKTSMEDQHSFSFWHTFVVFIYMCIISVQNRTYSSHLPPFPQFAATSKPVYGCTHKSANKIIVSSHFHSQSKLFLYSAPTLIFRTVMTREHSRTKNLRKGLEGLQEPLCV